MSNNCEVCKLVESKYKCPKCSILYCSVSCFKQHQESCIEVKIPKEEVVDEMYLLADSKELLEMIQKDPILENYLKTINEANDPISYLDQLKENDRFKSFTELVKRILKK